jgi:hypothetical protein
MADNSIRDFQFLAGNNNHLDPRVFLDLQHFVLPVADPAPPQLDELGEDDVPNIHSSTNYSLVLFGIQQVPSIWDFAQRVLANPSEFPHITAVHVSYQLWFVMDAWVYVSTRVFNTLLEEWVLTDGHEQTVLWYQLGTNAIPADAAIWIEPEEGGLEDVELLGPEGQNLLAHVQDAVWEDVEAVEDDGYESL